MKKEKQENSKRITPKLSWIILFIISAAMLIKGAMQQPQITSNLDEISELQQQIEYEQQRADEIDAMKENVNSDEYIEKIAREKLGMIKKDEIIFIDVTGEEE